MQMKKAVGLDAMLLVIFAVILIGLSEMGGLETVTGYPYLLVLAGYITGRVVGTFTPKPFGAG